MMSVVLMTPLMTPLYTTDNNMVCDHHYVKLDLTLYRGTADAATKKFDLPIR